MASRKRNPSPSVIDTLSEKPYEFESYQALRILERLDPEKVPLGEGFTPSNENIDLKSRVFLDWPPSDLYKLEPHVQEHQRYKLLVNFFGVAGVQGPLPLPYTEKVLDQLKNKDDTFAEFLNIFNHRLLSISYRIRKKYWVGLDYKQPHKTKLSNALFSLIGLQTGELKKRLNIPDRALLYYAGLLWQRPRSIKGCEAILKHYFGVNVEISPFQGKWRPMEKSQYTHIGFSGKHQVLGESAALGTKAWDPQGYLEIKMGPLKFDQFQGFLKKGEPYKILCELLRFYLGTTREFRVNLSLEGQEVSKTALGKGSNLGWTTWIFNNQPQSSDSQVTLYPLATLGGE